MRERVAVTLGGRERSLLPTFGVLEAFEDRCGSIAAHLARITDLTATLNARAWLVMKALEADGANARVVDGQSLPFEIGAVKQLMFEAGLWHESLVNAEIELIERLLYTPEQYTEKKVLAAAMAADQANILAGITSFSGSPLPT